MWVALSPRTPCDWGIPEQLVFVETELNKAPWVCVDPKRVLRCYWWVLQGKGAELGPVKAAVWSWDGLSTGTASTPLSPPLVTIIALMEAEGTALGMSLETPGAPKSQSTSKTALCPPTGAGDKQDAPPCHQALH